MKLLDAAAAATLLGVKVTTVYAYASRGFLQSVVSEDDPRKRLYLESELRELKRRGQAHKGQAAAAGGALDWGAPVLETRICEITRAGPKYRGHLARSLARNGATFEQVAALLWTATLPDDAPVWKATRRQELLGPKVLPHLHPVDAIRGAVLRAEFDDMSRFFASDEARIACAQSMILAAVDGVGEGGGDEGDDASIARSLAIRLGAPSPSRELVSAIDRALILVADHELNASTFTARVAASTGASLYACVGAALGTFTGPKHGGASDRVDALLYEAERFGSLQRALIELSRRGDRLAAFGHPLYSHGDPRFEPIIEALPPERVSHTLAELEDARVALALDFPNVDMGLALLARCFGLRAGAGATIFAIGRMAGWIAHALEQREDDRILRPRAHYLGE